MIEIRHKDSGEVLHRVDADALEGQPLSALQLAGANLAGMNLTRVNFRNADGALDSRDGLAAGRSYEALPWIP